MGISKRYRKESSESDSNEYSGNSTSDSSSSNTSFSADSKVKNRIKHIKKKSKKESSASSSRSSKEESPPKKRRQKDTSKSHKKTIETSHDKQHSTETEIHSSEKRSSQNLYYRERQRTEDQERHSEDHRNNSKWDRPSYSHENIKNRYNGRDNRECERNYRKRPRSPRNFDNRNRGRRSHRSNDNDHGGHNLDNRHTDQNYRNDEHEKNYRQCDDFQRPRSPRRNFDSRDDGYDHSNRFNNRNRGRQSYRSDDNDRDGRNRDNRHTDQNYRNDNYSNKDDRDRYREDRNDNQTYKRTRSPQRRRKFDKNSNDEEKSYEWGKENNNSDSDNKKKNNNDKPPVEKEKPNFGLSGKLTEDTNKVNGVIIKYSEPDEARKPKRRWRLYPFKGETTLPTLYIHRQSCFLIGRDRKVCDLPIDHPSCSKQHAALQYRLVPYQRKDGTTGKRVWPYLIDLESSNGTFINNKRIDAKKYVELLEKDVIKFGFSSREYVILHENSKEDQLDDDVINDPIDSTEVKTEPVE